MSVRIDSYVQSLFAVLLIFSTFLIRLSAVVVSCPFNVYLSYSLFPLQLHRGPPRLLNWQAWLVDGVIYLVRSFPLFSFCPYKLRMN